MTVQSLFIVDLARIVYKYESTYYRGPIIRSYGLVPGVNYIVCSLIVPSQLKFPEELLDIVDIRPLGINNYLGDIYTFPNITMEDFFTWNLNLQGLFGGSYCRLILKTCNYKNGNIYKLKGNNPVITSLSKRDEELICRVLDILRESNEQEFIRNEIDEFKKQLLESQNNIS